MKNKYLALSALVLLSLAQLFVPAKMIMGQEDILENGKQFKFRTAPLDPEDPMRGKYISLRFDANAIKVDNPDEWNPGREVFVFLKTDENGYAEIKDVTLTEPADYSANNFVNATVDYVQHGTEKMLFIKYPFERYYMEESKAYAAETIYNSNSADTSKITYAKVYIKNGESVLKDVMINGVSIKDVVKSEQ